MSNGRHLYSIIRVLVHRAPHAPAEQRSLIKPRRRLIYALVVNHREFVHPLPRHTSAVHFRRIACELSESDRHGRGHHLFARPARKSPQVRSNHSTVPPWKRNNYTRRCNYCGRLRWAALKITKGPRGHHAQHLLPSWEENANMRLACSDITNLSRDPLPLPPRIRICCYA